LGGILTNWITMKRSVEFLQKVDAMIKSDTLKSLPKKKASFLRRKHAKLLRKLEGLQGMKELPDIVVVVDPEREKIAVTECYRLGIPIIAILDTNCDPTIIQRPIPANHAGPESIELILSKIADGILEGSLGVSH